MRCSGSICIKINLKKISKKFPPKFLNVFGNFAYLIKQIKQHIPLCCSAESLPGSNFSASNGALPQIYFVTANDIYHYGFWTLCWTSTLFVKSGRNRFCRWNGRDCPVFTMCSTTPRRWGQPHYIWCTRICHLTRQWGMRWSSMQRMGLGLFYLLPSSIIYRLIQYIPSLQREARC